MNAIKNVKKMLEKELDRYASKGDLTPQEWGTVFEAVDAYKDLETICAMQEGYEDEEEQSFRSGRRYYPMSGRAPEYPVYEGRSYANPSYNNGGGRSYHGESFQEQLRRLMDSATNENERMTVQNMMNSLHY